MLLRDRCTQLGTLRFFFFFKLGIVSFTCELGTQNLADKLRGPHKQPSCNFTGNFPLFCPFPLCLCWLSNCCRNPALSCKGPWDQQGDKSETANDAAYWGMHGKSRVWGGCRTYGPGATRKKMFYSRNWFFDWWNRPGPFKKKLNSIRGNPSIR